MLRSSVFFPALECGKVFAHQRDGLLESIAFAIFVAELFVELCTVADHLLHRTCRGEGAALVTIDAVFPARASVGFSAEIGMPQLWQNFISSFIVLKFYILPEPMRRGSSRIGLVCAGNIHFTNVGNSRFRQIYLPDIFAGMVKSKSSRSSIGRLYL